MDRTHFLASQAFNRHTQTGPDTNTEIDAFYQQHGPDVFAHAFRLRRAVRVLIARFRGAAERKRDFARLASNR